MLTAEVMGALALGVLWVNVLLIAAAALVERSALGRRLAPLRMARATGRLLEGQVAPPGDGADAAGTLAERRTAQVGRAMTVAGPDRILFTDKKSVARVLGGALECSTGRVRIPRADGCEVWVGSEVSAQRDGALPFGDAWASASQSRGIELDVVQRVGPGMRVWAAGEREGDTLVPTLVATACPIKSLVRARRVLAAAALGAITGGALVTALVFVPPVFGTVSTVGGAVGLVFFLLVQPAGVAARNAARTPDRRPIGGVWQRA